VGDVNYRGLHPLRQNGYRYLPYGTDTTRRKYKTYCRGLNQTLGHLPRLGESRYAYCCRPGL
jgi:hypothetical protein